jgi:UDP-N-acetylmuramyl pentapeptide synthase
VSPLRRAAWLGYGKAVIALAPVWRPLLHRTLFVGITGSAGKTTTKDLVTAVLRTRLRGTCNRGSQNELFRVAAGILATRPDHAFRVQEIGVDAPGGLDRSLALLRPTVGVVTNVGLDHYTAFRSAEAIAAEKGKLVAALPPGGTAVLNADDPRVLAMRARCRCRVVAFGGSEDADVRVLELGAAWPDRLSLEVAVGGEHRSIRTRLCGTHWATSVLAAVAVGHVLGVPLEDAAAAIARVDPAEGRMSPVERADGVVFVRDDQKAPLWSLGACLDFVRAARARRKVIVIGTLSDTPGNPQRRYRNAAESALDAADHVVFVGRWARLARRARRETRRRDLVMVQTLEEAAEHLGGFLQPGDLVLLKGSRRADGLDRLVSAVPTVAPAPVIGAA